MRELQLKLLQSMAAHSKLAHMMALTCFPCKPGRYQEIPPPDKAPDNRGGVENRAPVKQPRYSTPRTSIHQHSPSIRAV